MLRRISVYALFFVLLAPQPAAAINVGVRAMTLRTQHYPHSPYPFTMQLSAGGEKLEGEVTLPVYMQYFFNPYFMLISADDSPHFSLRHGGDTLVNIGFEINEKGLALLPSKNCYKATYLGYVYPYEDFLSFVPRATLEVECKTPLGYLSIQFAYERP